MFTLRYKLLKVTGAHAHLYLNVHYNGINFGIRKC